MVRPLIAPSFIAVATARTIGGVAPAGGLDATITQFRAWTPEQSYVRGSALR